MKKIKTLFLALLACLSAGVTANAAALDTSQLSDITTSLTSAASWLSGPVTVAIVSIVVASIVIAIIKFAGRKAKPAG